MTTYIGDLKLTCQIECECGLSITVEMNGENKCLCGRVYLLEVLKEISESESPLRVEFLITHEEKDVDGNRDIKRNDA